MVLTKAMEENINISGDAVNQDLQKVQDPSKEHVWAVIGHLGGLFPAYFLCGIIPLLVWLLKGDDSAFVNKQSKEALNFQISLVIYETVAILVAFTIIGLPITVLAFIIFWILNLVCSIKGAVRTFKGLEYQYPWNLRIVK